MSISTAIHGMETCTNARLVTIARRISAFDVRATSLRAQATRCEPNTMQRQQLEQDASEFDNEICQLCTELRKAVNNVG